MSLIEEIAYTDIVHIQQGHTDRFIFGCLIRFSVTCAEISIHDPCSLSVRGSGLSYRSVARDFVGAPSTPLFQNNFISRPKLSLHSYILLNRLIDEAVRAELLASRWKSNAVLWISVQEISWMAQSNAIFCISWANVYCWIKRGNSFRDSSVSTWTPIDHGTLFILLFCRCNASRMV